MSASESQTNDGKCTWGKEKLIAVTKHVGTLLQAYSWTCIPASFCVARTSLKMNPCGFTMCQRPGNGSTKAASTTVASNQITNNTEHENEEYNEMKKC